MGHTSEMQEVEPWRYGVSLHREAQDNRHDKGGTF